MIVPSTVRLAAVLSVPSNAVVTLPAAVASVTTVPIPTPTADAERAAVGLGEGEAVGLDGDVARSR